MIMRKHTLLERMKIEAGLGHLAGTLMLVTVLMDALDTSRQGHLVTYERVCLQIEAEYVFLHILLRLVHPSRPFSIISSSVQILSDIVRTTGMVSQTF